MDALQHQFTGLSKEMMDTIIVAQNKMRDRFLATGQQFNIEINRY